jgi:hydroxymethylglutaryl-CoA reductase
MATLFGKLEDVNGELYPSLFEYTSDDYGSNYFVAELTEQRVAFINQLTPEQIVSVEVVGNWIDDHETCLAVEITFDNGEVLCVSACWICQEFVSNFYRPDEACKKEIIEYLQDQLTF